MTPAKELPIVIEKSSDEVGQIGALFSYSVIHPMATYGRAWTHAGMSMWRRIPSGFFIDMQPQLGHIGTTWL